MEYADQLPEGHAWRRANFNDKLLLRCRECDIDVGLTASDTQVGITVYCPECNEEMEYDFSWKDD